MLLQLRDCTVDLDRLRITRPGEVQSLTTNEARLLRYLLAHSDIPVDQDRLLREVWGYSPKVRSHTVRTTVSRLRAKIEADPSHPDHLLTIKGEGYRLLVDAEPEADHDPLIGRNADLAALSRAVSSHRLVTVVGPAGVGKTRVVRALARRWRKQGHAVVMCDLATVDDAPGLLDAVASALQVVPSTDPATQLGHALRGRGAVSLVLDELERIAEAAAPTLARWLETAPELRLVVSSRKVVHLPEEHVYALPLLAVEHAVALFGVRARQVDRAVTLPRPVVQELVEALDRLPLAIELAAGWVDLMSVEQLLSQLGDRLRVLRNRRVTGRHASLAAALTHSWESLEPASRRMLCQLAVFRGPFDVPAAESVARPVADVLPALRELTDRSWLRRSGGGGRRLLGMLHTVRAWVAAQADSDQQQACDRHLALFADRVSRHDVRDLPDIVAAVRYGLDTDPTTAFDMLVTIDGDLRDRGVHELRRELLQAACDRVGPDDPDRYVRLHVSLGDALTLRADEALPVLERAADRARATGNPELIARALGALGRAAVWASRTDALDLLREAVDAGRSVPDDNYKVQTLRWLAIQVRASGDAAEGLAYAIQARAIAERLGHAPTLAHALVGESAHYAQQGRLQDARVVLDRALALDPTARGRAVAQLRSGVQRVRSGQPKSGMDEIRAANNFFRAHGEPMEEAGSLLALGDAHLHAGEFDRALALAERARDIVRRTGSSRWESLSIALAQVQLARRDLVVARDHALHAIRWFTNVGEGRHAGFAWFYLAQVEHVAGNLDDAVNAYARTIDAVGEADAFATRSRVWWALVLAEQGRREDALALLPDDEALTADTEHDHHVAGTLCALAVRDPAAARAMLDSEDVPVGAAAQIAVDVVRRVLSATRPG